MAVLTAEIAVARPASMAWPRIALAAILCAAALGGALATSPAATAAAIAHDGEALTRLMRFMAGVKATLALAATAGLFWRLGAPVRLGWYFAYAASAAAMAAGPGLIWGMVHIGWGAACLHGGLLGTILLLWRDPETAALLAGMVTARRQAARFETG